MTPGANGALGMRLSSGWPARPARAAGSVHSVSRLRGRSRAEPTGSVSVRPKRALSGGVSLNVCQDMTQPVWSPVSHAGTFWKSPPTRAPGATWTFAPGMIALMSRRRTSATGSTSRRMSARRMRLPWEWPTRTKPRPRFSVARYALNASRTSSRPTLYGAASFVWDATSRRPRSPGGRAARRRGSARRSAAPGRSRWTGPRARAPCSRSSSSGSRPSGRRRSSRSPGPSRPRRARPSTMPSSA